MSKEVAHDVSKSVDPLQDSGKGSLSSNEFTDDSSIERSKHNPFLDPKIEAHWRKVYEDAHYECRNEFDPHLEWTEEEEKAIIRKLDWRVALWACIMFFALNVDRKNLPSAIAGDLLLRLGLSNNDYNYGNTIFLISFLLAEVPSQLVSKRIGPDRWIPIQMMLWSIVAAAQAGLTGRSSFYACRALLGLLEGGFIPDLILWLSYFYTSKELPLRLSFFWVSLNLTGVFIGLLGFALLRLDGHGGLDGWRWLFLIEGLITLAIGIASWFMMPASAVETKAWYRPNGWFTDREIKIVVNRVLRDDPSKGDMHNRQGITLGGLWEAMTDYHLWPIYAIGLIVYIPQGPVSNYLTISLRTIGFDSLITNLLTIPPVIVGCFSLIGLTWLSEKLNSRAYVSMLQNIWVLPCVIALRFWPGLNDDAWSTYGLIFTLLSYPYCHAIVVAWASRNSGSVRTRSISAAFYNMCVQLGNVISANIYVESDKPKYRNGNTVLMAIGILGILLFLSTKAYYVWENKRREEKWGTMSVEEKERYIETTFDEGNKRLDFRFAH